MASRVQGFHRTPEDTTQHNLLQCWNHSLNLGPKGGHVEERCVILGIGVNRLCAFYARTIRKTESIGFHEGLQWFLSGLFDVFLVVEVHMFFFSAMLETERFQLI